MKSELVTDRTPKQQQARATAIAFGAVAVVVTVLVSLLTGNVWLGLLYGLLPGTLLGALAWLRIARGGLIKLTSSKDRPGPF